MLGQMAEKHPSGAKARPFLKALLARMNPCPFKTTLNQDTFRCSPRTIHRSPPSPSTGWPIRSRPISPQLAQW